MSVPCPIELHVETMGAGPDLVLLHGWAMHGGMWGPWLDSLAQHARLHIVDLPGHGHSPWSIESASLAGLAHCVASHVPEGAAVLGWSLGGLVALELARQRVRAISSLVLLAATPSFVARADWPDGMDSAVLENFALGLARDHRRTFGNFLALQVRGAENELETLRVLRAAMTARREPDPAALVAGLAYLRDTDMRSTVGALTLPTLVIAGEYDRVTPPAAARRLAQMMPGARFVEIAKAGHAPFISHPQAVLEEVTRFIGAATH